METLERELFAEDPWTSTMIAQELSAPGRLYVMAEAGEPVGYGGVMIGPDSDIMTIGVRNGWRGRGIGRRLLDRLIDGAAAGGAERIFLEVRRSNTTAQHLYERAGFSAIGKIARYFHHPLEDAITMRLLVGSRDFSHIEK